MLSRLASTVVLLLASERALAQGDILGSNREGFEASSDEPPPSYGRSVPDRPYVPDPSRPLRRVRLLGENVVYRLEQPAQAQRVHRDLDAIPVVVCAEPPCDVWLPHEAALAVQLEGRSFALGRLTLPPGPGALWTAIGGRARRIVAGAVMVGTAVAGVALFAAGAGQDPDSFLDFRPFFFGLGAALIFGGLLTGGILLAIPRRGIARWEPASAGRGWH